MGVENDRTYRKILTDHIRVCADYMPKFGHRGHDGFTLEGFRAVYGKDPFYSWLGLDNPLMYAAHKAAGGMTSIYRQIGLGCEALFRRILQDSFGLGHEAVRWSYDVPRASGKSRTLHLDACLRVSDVRDPAGKRRIRGWMKQAARQLGMDSGMARSLKGIVFEIRQGYKSKDSKRQNADIANAAMAYTKGFLPCVGVLSTQMDEDIADRYRSERWIILPGKTGEQTEHESFYAFVNGIVGYDLAAFFVRNSRYLRREVGRVLKALLRPE